MGSLHAYLVPSSSFKAVAMRSEHVRMSGKREHPHARAHAIALTSYRNRARGGVYVYPDL